MVRNRPRKPGKSLWIVVSVIVLAGGAVAGVTLGGATASAQTDGDSAAISIVHASPDAPPLTVSIDGDPLATDLRFGTVTDYGAVEPGNHTIEITATDDQETVLFTGEMEVQANETYTVAAAGEVTEGATTSFEPVFLVDDPTVPSTNESSLRFVHLSPDAPRVDVIDRESGTVLFENVSYGEATGPANVAPGNHTLVLRSAAGPGRGENVAAAVVTIDGGTATTAFAIGYLRPDAAPADTPFDLLLVADTTTDGERSRSASGGS